MQGEDVLSVFWSTKGQLSRKVSMTFVSFYNQIRVTMTSPFIFIFCLS